MSSFRYPEFRYPDFSPRGHVLLNRLGCHFKTLSFDVQEETADGSHRHEEARRGRGLQILEKARRPAGDVTVKEASLCCEIRWLAEGAPDEARHHLAERGDMVLRLADSFSPRDAKLGHVLTQPRQGPIMEKTGQVIGGIGKQLGLAHADEEVEMLALDLLELAAPRHLGQRPDGLAQLRGIAFESA